ncbi:unnamed protein product [Adineta steineri]|uniref:Carbohydrate deacetylase n=1 Tax=Adineta steineri TaxID=433720 RepID=A0A818UY80_9BILA|nr:unnamed protein product [Adineta steineri]CAF3707167.1 unnamed protein product [Adineta steineri]
MSSCNNIKYLIINADDFGYCPKRDQAIVDLFKQKSISSTSLLVNGSNVYQACLSAKMAHLPMGIHLNLTEGRPVTNDFNRIESLINSHGLMHGKIGLRNELEKENIKQEHIEYEIEMQINKYKELNDNKLPRHIDGHQHIHVHPMIVESVARIARQYGINYIRAPQDQMILSFDTDNLFYKEIVNQTKSCLKIFDKYSLIYPKYFFGMTLMSQEFTLNNIETCLKILEQNQTEHIFAELMCHPGYPSDPLIGGCGTEQPDEFSQSIDRQYEFDILSSDYLRNLLENYNVRLSIYDEIF